MSQQLNNIPFVKYKSSQQQFKKHFHTTYSIGLVIDGVHKLSIENKQIIVPSKHIKIVNPYDLHQADGNIIWEYINFMPPETIIKALAEDICDNSIKYDIKFPYHINDSIASKYFLNLFYSLDNNIEYEENFIILISYLLKKYGFENLNDKQISSNIQKTIDFIHTYYLKEISLDTLSNISGVSKYHFIKVFSKETGLTPHQYIIDLRLNHALKLIKNKTPLSQIAFICGFSDQSHFIRTFKKHYGYTPTILL